MLKNIFTSSLIILATIGGNANCTEQKLNNSNGANLIYDRAMARHHAGVAISRRECYAIEFSSKGATLLLADDSLEDRIYGGGDSSNDRNENRDDDRHRDENSRRNLENRIYGSGDDGDRDRDRRDENSRRDLENRIYGSGDDGDRDRDRRDEISERRRELERIRNEDRREHRRDRYDSTPGNRHDRERRAEERRRLQERIYGNDRNNNTRIRSLEDLFRFSR